MRHLLLGTLLISTAATNVAGQAEYLQPGQRVRVTAPAVELNKVEATIVWLHGDTAVVRHEQFHVDAHGNRTTESVVTSVSLARLSKLEVRVGERSNIDKGIRTGVLIGAGLGLALGVASAASDDSGYVCSGGGCVLQGTLGGALWGLLIGAAVGAFTHRDEWLEIRSSSLSDRVQLGIAPQQGGFGIGASIAF